VRPPLRLGLELPPLSLSADTTASERAEVLGALQALAMQVQSLGFTALWLAEPPSIDLATDQVYADGCTLAASLAPVVGSAHLGVMMGDHDHRHPSIGARDVTALDHVTGGRAALMLRYRGRGRLTEAATICRGLFTQDETTVEGSAFRTSGAVNRPRPVQTGGPPLVVAVDGPDEVDASLVAEVDAVCAGGTPDQMHAISAAIRAADSPSSRSGGDKGGPALMWIGTPLDDGDDLRAAGVDGVICHIPAGEQSPTPTVAEEWAGAVDAWRRR
jgi:alkanesulfonate monooxygenase SsuD/methylene tetrahydromethanopterin reductase-like flavin-dependent oxidoreductase (luciferase family)